MFLEKTKFKNHLIGLITGFVVLGVGKISLAAYTLHEKIPGQDGVNDLQTYLSAIYKFGIAIVALLAVVMIAVGAFMYIVTSAGNAAKLANAKEIITSAILGLVMALLAWLILFVINPDLVSGGLNITSFEITEWVGDGKNDKVCNQPDKSFYENGICAGDKFCVQGQCIYKKDICPLNTPGVCNSNELAQPDKPCGPAKSVGAEGLVGKCSSKNNDCTNKQQRIIIGKQCADSVCCSDSYTTGGGF